MNPSNLLAWLNFFVSDVRDGLAPFLGVFLLQNGFGEAQVGLIATISSIIALTFGVPCGIWVDKTTRKKEFIALFIALIMLFCSLNYFFPSFIFTLLAQGLVAISGVFLAPAFAALTLGIIGAKNYPLQCARNEAYKHAGTLFGATLSFVFALYFGIVSVFVITAVLGAISLMILALIKRESIDDFTARGEIVGVSHSKEAQNLWALFADRRVVFLSVIMFCFHLSNAAMLPLLSQRAQKLGIDSSGAFAAATIIIAQGVMIIASLVCLRLLGGGESRDLGESSVDLQKDSQKNCANQVIDSAQDSHNPRAQRAFKVYFWLFFACFFALIIRGIIAANFAGISGMVFTQILDGIGAGVSGVIVPVIVAFMLRGSGHINAGLALVLTCGGLGAALSGGIGGYFAQFYGYLYAYLFLGAVAGLGLLLWLVGAKILVREN